MTAAHTSRIRQNIAESTGMRTTMTAMITIILTETALKQAF